MTINVYEYEYDFDETNATWNAPGSGDGTAGGALGTLLTSATFDPTVTADITYSNSVAFRRAVSHAVDADGILRLILARSDRSGAGTYRYVRFDDETVTPAANRPKLLVTHHLPLGSVFFVH